MYAGPTHTEGAEKSSLLLGPQMTAGRRELQAASTVTWLLSFVAALFFSVKIRNLTHVATTRDRRPGILLRICFGGGVLLHSTSWS